MNVLRAAGRALLIALTLATALPLSEEVYPGRQ